MTVSILYSWNDAAADGNSPYNLSSKRLWHRLVEWPLFLLRYSRVASVFMSYNATTPLIVLAEPQITWTQSAKRQMDAKLKQAQQQQKFQEYVERCAHSSPSLHRTWIHDGPGSDSIHYSDRYSDDFYEYRSILYSRRYSLIEFCSYLFALDMLSCLGRCSRWYPEHISQIPPLVSYVC